LGVTEAGGTGAAGDPGAAPGSGPAATPGVGAEGALAPRVRCPAPGPGEGAPDAMAGSAGTGAAGASGPSAEGGAAGAGALVAGASGVAAAPGAGTDSAAGALAGGEAGSAGSACFGGNSSIRRRTTGASMVELADFTNSPSSFSLSSSTRLVTPSSLASAETRCLCTLLLSLARSKAGTNRLVLGTHLRALIACPSVFPPAFNGFAGLVRLARPGSTRRRGAEPLGKPCGGWPGPRRSDRDVPKLPCQEGSS
jgi:hypothetical protein